MTCFLKCVIEKYTALVCGLFCENIYNLNTVTRKHPTDPHGRVFYKVTGGTKMLYFIFLKFIFKEAAASFPSHSVHKWEFSVRRDRSGSS